MDAVGINLQDAELVSALDYIHMPDKYRELVGRYPFQRSLDWMEKTGRYKEIDLFEYSHFEENRIKEPIVMGAVVADGGMASGGGTIPTNGVEIAVDASSIYTIDSTPYSSIRKYDRVEFSGNLKGIVTEVDKSGATHYFYVVPVSASYTLDASTVLEGDLCIIMGNAQPEGADVRDENLLPIVEEISNQTSIIRDDHEVTSTEMNNATWVDFQIPEGLPNAGGRIKGLVIKALDDMQARFNVERKVKLFTDDINDSGAVVDGKTIRTTRGFVPHTETYGNVLQYATQITLEDYNKFRRISNANHGGKSWTMITGLEYTLQNTNFGLDLITDKGYIQNSSGGKVDAVSLGFSVMRWPDGFEIFLQHENVFSHADTTGAENLDYSGMAIAMPNGTTKDYNRAEYMDNYAVCYNPARGKGAKGSYKFWSHGGNSPGGTDGKLVMIASIAAEEGTQIYGAKQFTLFKKKRGT